MGRTTATVVRATASDPTRVAKTGDAMSGTLTVPALTQFGAAASATTNYTAVTGDGGARFARYADGKMAWGNGAGTLDTNLYRSAADTLKTDDAFNAASLQIGGVGLGTWVAYTPVLSGTGWALGDSTLDAAYMRIGKTVWFSVAVAWGSTATYGAASTPRFTLPSTAATAVGLAVVGSGKSTAFDTGTNKYEWHLNFVNATNVAPVLVGANGDGLAGPTATTPFTWAAGDGLLLTGHYREA